jgi:hypothetical protein
MLNFCKKSCAICDFVGDLNELIQTKKRMAEVGGDERLLETPYGMKQTPIEAGSEYGDAVAQVLAQSTEYMETVIFADAKYESLKHTCKNRDRSCVFWAAIGECEKVRT